MDENTSTVQPGPPAVHTQTLMVALVPAVASLTEEITRPKRGQPTKRNETAIDEICANLKCAEVLTMICADPAMPAYRTVTPRIFRK
jgi:hypothetical protein